MIMLAGITAFVGGLLTASVFAVIFAPERIRRRDPRRPYAL